MIYRNYKDLADEIYGLLDYEHTRGTNGLRRDDICSQLDCDYATFYRAIAYLRDTLGDRALICTRPFFFYQFAATTQAADSYRICRAMTMARSAQRLQRMMDAAAVYFGKDAAFLDSLMSTIVVTLERAADENLTETKASA